MNSPSATVVVGKLAEMDPFEVFQGQSAQWHLNFLKSPDADRLFGAIQRIVKDKKARLPEWVTPNHLFYEWWRFMARRRDAAAQAIWQKLRESEGGRKSSRDQYMLDLWRYLQTLNGERYLDESRGSQRYHQDLMFGWFLARYDINRALQCYCSQMSRLRHAAVSLGGAFLFAGTMAMLLYWFHAIEPSGGRWWWRLLGVVALYSGYLLALVCAGRIYHRTPEGKVRSSEPQVWTGRPGWTAGLAAIGFSQLRRLSSPRRHRWVPAIQSLVPRLMGTAAVGFLFLLNTEQVFRDWLLPRSGAKYGPGILLVAAWAYLILEIIRRVDPDPKLSELLERSTRIVLLGLAHSCSLFIITGPNLDLGKSVEWPQVLGLVIFVMAVGLVLNVIWAEEPVTEPL